MRRFVFSLCVIVGVVSAVRSSSSAGLLGRVEVLVVPGVAHGGNAGPLEMIGIGGVPEGIEGRRAARKVQVQSRGSDTTFDRLATWCSDDAAPSSRDSTWISSRIEAKAVALLAFVGAGYTHDYGKYKGPVKAAARQLRSQQDAQGGFGAPAKRAADVRADIASALALTELYGLTTSPLFRNSAYLAVEHVGELVLDDRFAEWLDEDIALLAWAALAFRSADTVGFEVPFRSVRALRVAVESLCRDRSWITTPLDHASLAFSAILFSDRVLDRDTEADRLREEFPHLVEACLAHLPDAARCKTDPDYVHFATLALWQYGGEEWKSWEAVMKHGIPAPSSPWPGDEPSTDDPALEAERMREVSLLTMCAEVYYRYDRVAGGR